jgi:hypothetical protein
VKLKSQVAGIDDILETLEKFDEIPGLEVLRAETETARQRLQGIKETVLEELRRP